jgi:hypothetical protein
MTGKHELYEERLAWEAAGDRKAWAKRGATRMASRRQPESISEPMSDSDGKLLPTGKRELNKERLVWQALGKRKVPANQ